MSDETTKNPATADRILYVIYKNAKGEISPALENQLFEGDEEIARKFAKSFSERNKQNLNVRDVGFGFLNYKTGMWENVRWIQRY